MKTEYFYGRLAANGGAVAALAAGIGADQSRWKPSADAWSVLEVINHLADEELEDFRQRLDLTLHQPQAPWPAIDPGADVLARRYNTRKLADSVQSFTARRAESLQWLRALDAPDWTRTRSNPQFGSMTAGALLASWQAHDCLHLRQLSELLYAHAALQAAPLSVAYAGEF